MFTGRMGRIAVFCSYAREDSPIRESLERYLAPLRDTKVIDDWYDSHIQPGAHWDDEIQQALDRARLMIFIVSPDLLASRYVSEVEIPHGLERERAGECRVIPILARRSEWKSSPLSRFQALPGGGRWLDDGADADSVFREVVSGIRETCRQIVDWENPYKRAQIGDWTLQEQTITVAGGASRTMPGTEELIARTDTAATLLMEMGVGNQVMERKVTIDLTRPLEDRLADIVRQGGGDIPPNLEVSTGPAKYGEEHVSIGGRRYETIRTRRELTLGMRGVRESGQVTQWRSIDVPLFGLVKGEGETPGWRQYQVLLDFGHGDAATRKPRLPGSRTMGENTPPPAPTFGPGHWVGQMQAGAVRTDFELLLHPSGALQGRQSTMGVQSELTGQWMFNPPAGLLTFQVVASTMGVPTGQELIQIRLTGNSGAILSGSDASGRTFQLQRVG